MKTIFSHFFIRNFKRIPYFFTRTNYQLEDKYILIGKLSTSLLHDILSPLTSLSIAQEIATHSNTSSIKSIIENSNTQIKEYVDIMRDFLQEEKNLNTKILINAEIVKCLTLLKHKITQNNIQIQFLEFDQVYSKVSPLHIYQIIINLLTNAIEASLESPTKKIILIIKKQDDNLIIECKDFGCGIKTEILHKIGEYNLSSKSTTRGFGLYSVSYIINFLLKGSLLVQSEEHTGSLFTCILPIIK
jgi:signal transduction histidine kinase